MEDLISRQAVMDCFKKWQPYMATRLWDFEQELSALPSVIQQEPCNDITAFKEDVLDAISRIDLLKSGTKEVQVVAECLRAVEALSPVKPQESKWIPVSERLPEYTDDYTVTVGINNGNRMYYAVRTALYQIRFNQWIVYESEKTLVGEVIAWQDSPEPYKPQERSK